MKRLTLEREREIQEAFKTSQLTGSQFKAEFIQEILNEMDGLREELSESRVREAKYAGALEQISDEESYDRIDSIISEARSVDSATAFEAIRQLSSTVQSLLEIGKRDLTNPKYDTYFTGLKEELKAVKKEFPCLKNS